MNYFGYVAGSGGVQLHYVEKGDRTKPLMLFLHGFPEFWYSWRFQLAHFSSDYWYATNFRKLGIPVLYAISGEHEFYCFTLIEFGHSGSETLKLVKFDFFFQNLANGSLGVVV
jgi:pimeloyl-ACP methyl ester carboxylesterase